MQGVQDRLLRQTERIDELASLATQHTTAGSLQALGSAYEARGETHVVLGNDRASSDDFREAAALFATVITRWDRRDLLERMLKAGQDHRAALDRLGQTGEGQAHLLGEAQLLIQFGSPLEAARRIDGLATSLREGLAEGKGSLSTAVQANILLSGAYMSARQPDKALGVSASLVETLSSCKEHEELAAVRMARAVLLHGVGRIDDALEEARATIEDLEVTAEADPSYIPLLIQTLGEQATFFEELGRHEEMAHSLDHCLELAADNDGVSAEDFAGMLRRHAQAAMKSDDLDGAWNSIDSACELLAEVEESEGTWEATQALNMARYERALICHAAERYDLALGDAEELVESWSAIVANTPERLDLKHMMLMGLDLRERSLSELGRHEEALKDQTAIVTGFQSLLEQGAPAHVTQGLMVTLARRIDTFRHFGRIAEAESDEAMLHALASRARA